MNSKPHIIVSEPHRSSRKARGRTYEYWRVRWKCPYTGRSLSKLLGRCDEMTKRDARAEAQRFAVELAARSGPLEPGKTKSVADLFEGYFQTRDLAPRRVANMRSTCNSLAGLFDARLPARDLTPTHADRWRKHLADSRCAPQTMKSHITHARAVWSWGVSRGYVDANPFADLVTSSEKTTTHYHTTLDELADLLAACRDDDERNLLRCCRLLGLRRNEAIRATFDDIDWDDRAMAVHPRDGRENCKQRFRLVGIMLPDAYSWLLRARLEVPGVPGEPHYICGDAHRWSDRRLDGFGARVVRAAGKRRRRNPLQQMRVDYADWLRRDIVARGGTTMDASRMLGHSDKVSGEYYHTLTPADVRRFTLAATRKDDHA